MRQAVLSSDFVWLCSTCYSCHERCPQNVRITDLMHAIKNIAVQEGHIHSSYRLQLKMLRSHGRLYDITGLENERRTDQGLPAIQEQAGDFVRLFAISGIEVVVPPEQGDSP
jgi:heterodisulfide reductase subunit C